MVKMRGIAAMFFVAALLPARLGAVTPAAGRSSCTTHCGNISIPYPFGVEPGCYHGGGFNLSCNHLAAPPSLLVGDGTVEVLEIDLTSSTVSISSSFLSLELSTRGAGHGTWLAGGIGDTLSTGVPYPVADQRDNSLAIGCDVQVRLLRANDTLASSCTPFFPRADGVADLGICSGNFCCQATAVQSLDGLDQSSYGLQVHLGRLGVGSLGLVYAAFVVEELDFANTTEEVQDVPAVLGWTVKSSSCYSNGSSPSCPSEQSFCQNYTAGSDAGPPDPGHNCYCSDGYQGNPYISDGCYDINECDHPDIYPCFAVCKNTKGGYDCQCPLGFKGNASKHNGCEDIDECKYPEAYPCYGVCINMPGTYNCQCHYGATGDPLMKHGCVTTKRKFIGFIIGLVISGGFIILLLALVAPCITRKIKLSRENKQKEIFFKQNHGLLLQKLISQKTDFGERMIISLSDLQKATNNFDKTCEAGGGGHGIVYKGILDLLVVAVKKSKIVIQREIDDFINEVAILSQINHRNVVKLIGCCLETEVPLLVYEFISNGTLDHHLHVEGPISLSWDDRIRIALEVSRALSYLHSAASVPIYHRDIKSSNILLDDNLTAKVSDFGASRYIPIDQTGVTTAVQGTIGYLDPMYYYTGRLTDKSDVFSFGVLLIELLTRKKPFVYRCGGDGVGLVSHFVSLLTEGNLNEIIDPQVIQEENGEVKEVAALAAMCTRLKGEERPTMREVEMKLENLTINKRRVATHATSRRYSMDQTGDQYMQTEGVTREASRQYTMEEEILMSARYPR